MPRAGLLQNIGKVLVSFLQGKGGCLIDSYVI